MSIEFHSALATIHRQASQERLCPLCNKAHEGLTEVSAHGQNYITCPELKDGEVIFLNKEPVHLFLPDGTKVESWRYVFPSLSTTRVYKNIPLKE